MSNDHRRRSGIRAILFRSVAASLIGAWLSSATAGLPAITVVEPLSLHYGSNDIPRFLPDGRPATIVMVHRENGNAHGYNLYVMYADDAKGRGTAPGIPELIDLQTQTGTSSDVIRDEPFDGEAEIDALRFVRTRVDGRSVMALVQARRQVDSVMRLTDPAPVELTVWRLDGPTDLAGRTAYAFLPAGKTVTERRYCNATSALQSELGIAYPDGWDGEPSVDGCVDAAKSARDGASSLMLQRLDATSFDNSTGPRRQAGLRTFADYGFTQFERFADGWSYASEADHSWTVGLLVLEDGPQRKLLCVTDSANGSGTYRSTAVVEVVPAADGLWHATGRAVQRPDCAAR